MLKKKFPEYHKALLEPSTYPSHLRRVKFEETPRCYFYKTGDFIYKIRKTGGNYPSLAIKERFAREAFVLGKRWAPEVVQEVVPIVKTADGGYALGAEGTIVDYALKLTQLADRYWLYKLLTQQKLNAVAVGRLSRFLADHHEAHAVGEQGLDAGRPEHFRALMDEILYQSKKYLDVTLTQPMLDMVSLPFNRFVDDSRKLFIRRQKRGRIVDGHGSFIPAHLFIKGPDIYAIAPLEAQPKFRVLDAANDVATLLNELCLQGATDCAELFVKRYITASKDRDLPRMLHPYRTLQAMRFGLLHSQRLTDPELEEKARPEVVRMAGTYFNLAVQVARKIGQAE